MKIYSIWYITQNKGEINTLTYLLTIISTNFAVKRALTNKYLPQFLKYLPKYIIDVRHTCEILIYQNEIILDEKKRVA